MTQYNMTLTEEGKSILDPTASPEVGSSVKSVHEFLNGKPPREMELPASVHYIASYDDGKHSGRVHEIITHLKPGAGFSKPDVDRAMGELKSRSLLDAAA